MKNFTSNIKEGEKMFEITNSNERMRAALDLLKLKAGRKTQGGFHVLLNDEDVEEILLVAGMSDKELEVI